MFGVSARVCVSPWLGVFLALKQLVIVSWGRAWGLALTKSWIIVQDEGCSARYRILLSLRFAYLYCAVPTKGAPGCNGANLSNKASVTYGCTLQVPMGKTSLVSSVSKFFLVILLQLHQLQFMLECRIFLENWEEPTVLCCAHKTRHWTLTWASLISFSNYFLSSVRLSISSNCIITNTF